MTDHDPRDDEPAGEPPDAGDEDETDAAVPTELLELYEELEAAGVTPEEFREAFGDES